MARTWFDIRNAAADEAEILIYDEIGGWGISANALIDQLNGITAGTIHVRINSPGGGVTDGWAIYNALRRHPARIVSHIDGLAASIATLIALSAEEVHAARGTFFMIHNTSGGAMGGSEDLRRMAELMDKMEVDLRDLYVEKTGLPLEQIRAWMDAETWFTAREAFEHGFVDVLDEAPAPDACLRLDLVGISNRADFRNVPPDLTPAPEEMLNVQSLLGDLFDATIDEAANISNILAALKRGGEELASVKAKLTVAENTAADLRLENAKAVKAEQAAEARAVEHEKRVTLIEKFAGVHGVPMDRLEEFDPAEEVPKGDILTRFEAADLKTRVEMLNTHKKEIFAAQRSRARG